MPVAVEDAGTEMSGTDSLIQLHLQVLPSTRTLSSTPSSSLVRLKGPGTQAVPLRHRQSLSLMAAFVEIPLGSLPPTTTSMPTVFPLTIVFKPPPHCTLNGLSAGWQARVVGNALDVNDFDAACVPHAWRDNGASFPYAKVSPGVCPGGWTPGSSTIEGSKTSVVCCLAGTIADSNSPTCTASFTTPVALYEGTWRATTSTFNPADLSTFDMATVVNEYVMTVTWDSSDLVSFTPASAPLLMKEGQPFTVATTTYTAPSATSTSHMASSSPSREGDAGLLNARLMGLTVQEGAALLLFGAMVFVLGLRWRSSHRPGGMHREPLTKGKAGVKV